MVLQNAANIANVADIFYCKKMSACLETSSYFRQWRTSPLWSFSWWHQVWPASQTASGWLGC